MRVFLYAHSFLSCIYLFIYLYRHILAIVMSPAFKVRQHNRQQNMLNKHKFHWWLTVRKKNLNTNTYCKRNIYIDNILLPTFIYTMSSNYRSRTYVTINRRLDEQYNRLHQTNRARCKWLNIYIYLFNSC